MASLKKTFSRWRSSKDLQLLFKGSVLTFGMKMVGSFAGLGLAVLIARYLGANGAGVYYTASSAAFLVGTVARFGMPVLLMRETAASYLGGARGYRALLQRIITVVAAGTFVSILLLVAFSGHVAELYGEDRLQPLLMLWGIIIFLVTFTSLSEQILRGVQLFAKSSFIVFTSVRLFNLPLLLLFSLGLADVLGVEPLFAVVIAQIAATVLSAAIAVKWARFALAKIPHPMWGGQSGLCYKEILRTGTSLLANMLSSSAMRWADTLILAAFVLAGSVGVYNSAARVEAFLLFMSTVTGTVAGPRFSAAYRRRDWGSLIATFKGATFLGTGIVFPVALLIWVFSEPVMGLFGPDFRSGAPVLQVLLLGALVSAAVGPYGELLIAMRREQHVRNAALGSVIVGIALHFALAPRYGALGSAMATTASVSIRNLWNLAAGWWYCRIPPAWVQVVTKKRFAPPSRLNTEASPEHDEKK